MTHSTRFAPPSRSHGDASSKSARAAAASASLAPANRGSGTNAARASFSLSREESPKIKQSSGLPSLVSPNTTCRARCLDCFDTHPVACAMRSKCASFEYGAKYAMWTQSPGTPPGSAPKSITSSPFVSSYVVDRTRRQVFLSVETHASYPRQPSG